MGRKPISVVEVMEKMIIFSCGNTHDINHFIKVHSYARLIGELEQIDESSLRCLEIAAIVHDIACPLCREKYSSTNGKMQEKEGMPLVREFFNGAAIEAEVLERVVFLVGHHHTLVGIDGIDYQILLEADYLVNADEGGFTRANIKNTGEKLFKTASGKKLLQEIFLS